MAARIAMVDDEESVRVALGRVLRLAGYEVTAYTTGEEFLAGVEKSPPDCALLDVHLPGMTGIQVQLRLQANHVHLPAVFITASEGDEVERAVHGVGDFCLLRKPFSSRELLDSIESALGTTHPAAP